jgi:hypothetical protein
MQLQVLGGVSDSKCFLSVKLTKCLPCCQMLLLRKEEFMESLVCTICDRWVRNEDQTGLEASPQSRNAVIMYNFLCGLYQALPLRLWLSLLSGRDDGYWDGEELRKSTCNCADSQLLDGREVGRPIAPLEEVSDGRVPAAPVNMRHRIRMRSLTRSMQSLYWQRPKVNRPFLRTSRPIPPSQQFS